MRKKRFFSSAGEKRKFYNNLRHFGGTRGISIACMGLVPMLGFIGLFLGMAIACAIMFDGSAHAEMAKGNGHAMQVLGAIGILTPNLKSLVQKKTDTLKVNTALLDKAEAEDRDLTAEEKVTYEANVASITSLNARIDRQQEHATAARGMKIPEAIEASAAIDIADNADKPFRSFGEQLMAVHRAEVSPRSADPRLIVHGSDRHRKMVADERSKLYAGPAGLDEAIPSEGGFLVQTDFAAELIQRTYSTGEILSRVKKMPISNNSNRLVMNGVDETSRQDGSRFGGVQAFWANEADQFTASKPKFRKIELILNKLTALCFATDELLADAPALETWLMEAVPQELAFKLEDGIINGPGNGQPQGLFNSAAKITVAKEAGQATGTIAAANIFKMWSRMWGRSRLNGVWLWDQSVEPQFFGMVLPNAGVAVPIWLPPGGISTSPYGTIFGRPVIPVEYCAALSTEGDVMFVDPSQFILAEKGGVQMAQSMHVKFLTDEMTYRFITRADGQSLWNKPLTPKNAGNTLSPFITLQTR